MEALEEAQEFNDPDPGISEESGQTFTSILSRSDVIAAIFIGHNVAATPSSREAFESPMLNPAAVNVERSKPVLGCQCQFFCTGAGCRTSCFIDSKPSCSFPIGSKPPKAKGNLFKTSNASWEKSYGNGGKESRVNGFAIYATNYQEVIQTKFCQHLWNFCVIPHLNSL